jgi:uncharacterized protein
MRVIPLLFFTFVFLLIDIYTFYGLKQIVGQDRMSKIFPWVYFAISALGYYSLLQLMISVNKGLFGQRTEVTNLMIGLVFTLFVTKLVFSVIMVLQDGGRALIGLVEYSKTVFGSQEEPDQFIPQRRKFIGTAATIIAAIPFFTMIYGITRGKYKYTVEKITLTFKDLPKSFDGFKLVQISDIHAGSFDNKESVRSGVHMINDLDPDMVCFTGDLVNSEKDEIDPYIDIFGEIKAKYGKYAVLGNHDYYGSYDRNDANSKAAYFSDFKSKFKKMGFDLLNNTNRKINIGESSISLVGVENWGAGRWFPKEGDLNIATQGVGNDDFSILMSHDPTHWDEKVIHHENHMHLTLSGHTHGFQFGFQIPGFKWSPAKYRYPRWMGLYQEQDKYLYVNRGYGFLGFPGRIGMWPEITLIELKSV